MKKHLIATFVSTVIMIAVVTANAFAFSDIYNHWARPYVEELRDRKISEGYSDNTFKPNGLTSREEAAQFLSKSMKSMGVDLDDSTASLIDIKGRWSEKSINELANFGLISGYPDRTFKPEASVSRAEVAKMMSIYLGKSADVDTANGFKDVDRTHWAESYIIGLKNLNIINGYEDGTFKPDNNVSRAEFATMTVRMLRYIESIKPKEPVEPDGGLLKAVNKARKEAGLSEVKHSDYLHEQAMIRAEEASRFFSHTRPDGTGIFSTIGLALENLGASNGFDLDYVMNSWHNSEGHRNNMLNPDRKLFGGGYYEKDGTVFWVQLFSPKENEEMIKSMEHSDSKEYMKAETLAKLSDATNKFREKNGLQALERWDNLHNHAMVRAIELSHDYSVKKPIYAHINAENIGRTDSGDVDEIMSAWTQSQSYSQNILNPNYKKFGLGIYEKDGVVYWVQLFSQY